MLKRWLLVLSCLAAFTLSSYSAQPTPSPTPVTPQVVGPGNVIPPLPVGFDRIEALGIGFSEKDAVLNGMSFIDELNRTYIIREVATASVKDPRGITVWISIILVDVRITSSTVTSTPKVVF